MVKIVLSHFYFCSNAQVFFYMQQNDFFTCRIFSWTLESGVGKEFVWKIL